MTEPSRALPPGLPAPADPTAGILPTAADSPLADLLQHLPRLSGRADGIDFPASDPSALVSVANAAESTVQRTHLGLQALGRLLASLESDAAQEQAAPALPALGLLVTELSVLASHCSELAADCRRETLDYAPGSSAEDSGSGGVSR